MRRKWKKWLKKKEKKGLNVLEDYNKEIVIKWVEDDRTYLEKIEHKSETVNILNIKHHNKSYI